MKAKVLPGLPRAGSHKGQENGRDSSNSIVGPGLLKRARTRSPKGPCKGGGANSREVGPKGARWGGSVEGGGGPRGVGSKGARWGGSTEGGRGPRRPVLTKGAGGPGMGGPADSGWRGAHEREGGPES